MQEQEFDFNGVGRFEKVYSATLAYRMRRCAWLSQRIAYGHDYLMGQFHRAHCGWVMADGTVRANGTGIGVRNRLKTETWRDVIAVAATENGLLGLRKDGTVLYAGDDKKLGRAVSQLRDVKQMDARGQYVGFLLRDGTVFVNYSGSLSTLHELPQLKGARQICVGGYDHFLALMEDGTLGGGLAKGLERYKDLVWVTVTDKGDLGDFIITGLTDDGHILSSRNGEFLKLKESACRMSGVAVARYSRVPQFTLFAMHYSGELLFSEYSATRSCDRGGLYCKDYAAIWGNVEGEYVIGISEQGDVHILKEYLDDALFPEKIEW